MPRRTDRPVLVTSAQRSRHEERDERQRRYLISMGFRTVAFVLSVVLLHGVARFIAVAAAMTLPWIAVLIANAGPKQDAGTPEYFTPDPLQAIEAAPGAERERDRQRT